MSSAGASAERNTVVPQTAPPDNQEAHAHHPPAASRRRGLSVDSWAVLLALAAAALVKLHILNAVKW